MQQQTTAEAAANVSALTVNDTTMFASDVNLRKKVNNVEMNPASFSLSAL